MERGRWIAVGALVAMLGVLSGCGGDEPAGTAAGTAAGTTGGGSHGAEATVTPDEGGTLTSEDGRLTVTVPPGAVTEATEIWVDALPEAEATAAFPDAIPAGLAYELGPDGQTFAVPVQLALTLGLGEVPTTENGVPAMQLNSRSTSAGDEVLTVEALDGLALEPPAALTQIDNAAATVVIRGETSHFSLVWLKSDGIYYAVDPPAEIEVCVGQEWTAALSLYNGSSSDTTLDRAKTYFTYSTCPVTAVLLPRGAPCTGGTDPVECCELYEGGMPFNPSGSGLKKGAKLTLDPPARFRCEAAGPASVIIFASAGATGSATVGVNVLCKTCPPAGGGATQISDSIGDSPVAGRSFGEFFEQIFLRESSDANGPVTRATRVDLGPAPAPPQQIVVPGVAPSTATALADGSFLLGGETATGAPSLGRINADGSAAWHIELAASGTVAAVAPIWPDLLAAQERSSSLVLSRVTPDGQILDEVSFDAPSPARPKELFPHSAGGYVLVANVPPIVPAGVARDVLVIRADAAGAFLWQKRFATGGFTQIGCAVEASDGGVLLCVRPDVGQISALWQLAPDGSLVLQKQYEGFEVGHALSTPTGFTAVGTLPTGLAALELGPDGLIASGKTYTDTGAMGGFFPSSAARLGDGRLAIAAGSVDNGWLSLVTDPDLTLPTCGDAGFGAPAATAGVVVTDGTATESDAAFVATPGTPAGAATAIVPAAGTATTTNLCL